MSIYTLTPEQIAQTRKDFEIWVSWDTTDFWYATDDMLDALKEFSNCIEQNKQREEGTIKLIAATDNEKLLGVYPAPTIPFTHEDEDEYHEDLTTTVKEMKA